MAKEINVLFITDSDDTFESCKSLLPTDIRAIRSSASENKLSPLLSEQKPVAVFIIFAKGERVKKMNLDYLFSYIDGYCIRLFAVGSAPQIKSLREMYYGDLLSDIGMKDIRRMALLIKSDIAEKKKRSKEAMRKNIVILSADIITSSIFEDALGSDNEERRFIYIDMRILDRLIPRLLDMTVNLFVLSDSGEITEKAVSSIKKYFPETPYVLLQRQQYPTNSHNEGYCIDISKDNFAVRSTVESILNEEKYKLKGNLKP